MRLMLLLRLLLLHYLLRHPHLLVLQLWWAAIVVLLQHTGAFVVEPLVETLVVVVRHVVPARPLVLVGFHVAYLGISLFHVFPVLFL